MFIDDAVVSPVVQGTQVHPMSRGVTADWPQHEAILAQLAATSSVSVRQGETLITGVQVDGLAEAVQALRTCHARVRAG